MGDLKWTAILSLLVLSCINFLDAYSRYLISVSLLPYVNYSSYEYGLLSGALFSVIYAVGGVLISLQQALTQHAVAALTIATLLFSISFFFTGLTTNFLQLCIIRIIMGLGQSVFVPYSTRILGALFPSQYKGMVFGVFNFAIYLAFAVVLSLGTYMYDSYGWRAGYFLFGLMGCALGASIPFTVSSPTLTETTAEAQDYRHSDRKDSKYIDGYRQISISDESAFLDSITTEATLRDGLERSHDSRTFDPNTASHPLLDARPDTDSSDTPSLLTKDSSPPTALASLFQLLAYWRAHPSLFLLSAAMGVRLAGGFIWSAYTAVYFSELFVDEGDSCLYSYSIPSEDFTAPFSTLSYGHTDVVSTLFATGACGADYPYCVGGVCSDVAQTPWHNQGMSHERLEAYMSWVPLVGSGLGSIIGGWISDQATQLHWLSAAQSVSSRDASLRTENRSLVAAVSSLLSCPLILIALRAGFPTCFIYMVFSGLIGEMYIGITITLMSDLCPRGMVVRSTALLSLLTTALAAGLQLLIPLLKGIFDEQNDGHSFTFTAASTGSDAGATQDAVTVHRTGAAGLQKAMFYTLGASYLCSAGLYLLSYLQIKRDIVWDSESMESNSVNSNTLRNKSHSSSTNSNRSSSKGPP